jgi:hypothetical protein
MRVCVGWCRVWAFFISNMSLLILQQALRCHIVIRWYMTFHVNFYHQFPISWFVPVFIFIARRISFQLGHDKFIQTSRWSDHPELLYEKSIYSYEYMDGCHRFLEASLRPKDCFYSKLSEQGISDVEYARAWNTFGCKTMQDYHDIYLITPSKCRIRSLLWINWTHFHTLSSLSWDALLKLIKLDSEIYLFLENNIRDDVSMSKLFTSSMLKDYSIILRSAFPGWSDDLAKNASYIATGCS